MTDGAPIFTLRRLFGLIVLFSTIRFIYYGWVDCQILSPIITFPFEEFDFLPRPNYLGTCFLFLGMLLGGLSIVTGRLFKLGCTLFFVCFTYVELLDKTNYLNHYYFVSLLSFLLIFSSAHQEKYSIPKIQLNLFKFIIGLVYFLAGIAKLNQDWLIDAQPLAMWLPAHAELPIIGWLFKYKTTAYLFSWGGALFDITAPFFLLSKHFRKWFYGILVIFHILTWILFPIGIFPWVMICCATIFFPAEVHRKFWNIFPEALKLPKFSYQGSSHFLYKSFSIFFIVIQIVFPFRYLMYPGNLFWHESGYRFSWRVMLMEKPAWAKFYIKDSNGIEEEIILSDWLTRSQIKMMSSQPDMLVQFSRILKNKYLEIQGRDIKVRAEVWASLNGRRSQLFIEPFTDLSALKNTWAERDYVLPLDSVISPLEYKNLEPIFRKQSKW